MSREIEIFKAAVELRFPEFKQRNWTSNGPYMAAHDFADYLNEAIGRGDFNAVDQAYNVIEGLLKSHPDEDELFNILSVGVIEHFNFRSGPHGIEARKRMPAHIKTQWLSLKSCWIESVNKRIPN